MTESNPASDQRTDQQLHTLLDTMPSLVLVLDRSRRITFANHALLSFLGATDQTTVQGKRLGEALDCQHARECGCGGAEACSTCGAAKAIIAMAQHHYPGTEECRISQYDNAQALDFRVHTAPCPEPYHDLFLLYLTDISHEKRRRALERIFFHDVINLTSGLTGMSRLLSERQLSPEKHQLFLSTLHRQALRLNSEVEGQRDLSAAEHHELLLELQPCASRSLLQELADFYCNHGSQGAQVVVDPASLEISMQTDPRLLHRVLGNMTKNAVEASPRDGLVRLGCESTGDGQVLFWVHNQGYMERRVQLQIFQRSFSTKGDGRGLGTYSIRLLGEKYLQGRVSFTSDPEEGTVFRFLCPSRLMLNNG